MKRKIWDFWAKRYDRLWVQKYSLKPTRKLILDMIKKDNNRVKNSKILDLGCGTGELINSLENLYENFHITGIDFSTVMLNLSRTRNPRSSHIEMDIKDLDKLQDKFNLIVCTHSLPYYKNLEKTIVELDRLLEDDGAIYFAFASGDSFYDKIVLSFVKLTTGPACYPSVRKFSKIVSEKFQIERREIIKKRFFMPRIAFYKLVKAKR